MSLLLPFLGALGIFLFGLTLFEHSLNTIGGETFKRFMKQTTDSLRGALLIGMIATAILHNSALISLVAIGFASAKLISLQGAFAMILGANIGTTFSGWTIALIGFNLDLQIIVYPLLFVSGIVGLLWGEKPTIMNIVKAVAGFSLLFLGLDMLKSSVAGLAGIINLQQYAHRGVSGFFVLGVIITVIIQSSTLMRTLTMTALFSQIITFDQALSLIIGANLGTTSTALVASMGGNAIRRQVAMSQVIFNLISSISIIGVPWFAYLMTTYGDATSNPMFALARFDTIFNVIWTLIFIPFIGPFTRRLEQLFPERHTGTALLQIDRVHDTLRETNIVALQQDITYLEHKVYSFVAHMRHSSIKHLNPDILVPYDAEVMIHKYDGLKTIHNKLLHHMLNMEAVGRSKKETLTHLIERVQSLFQSAKSLKEVAHHIQSAATSETSLIRQTFSSMRHRILQTLSVLSSGDAQRINTLGDNDGEDKHFLIGLKKDIQSGHLNEQQVLLMSYLNRYTTYCINALTNK